MSFMKIQTHLDYVRVPIRLHTYNNDIFHCSLHLIKRIKFQVNELELSLRQCQRVNFSLFIFNFNFLFHTLISAYCTFFMSITIWTILLWNFRGAFLVCLFVWILRKTINLTIWVDSKRSSNYNKYTILQNSTISRYYIRKADPSLQNKDYIK